MKKSNSKKTLLFVCICFFTANVYGQSNCLENALTDGDLNVLEAYYQFEGTADDGSANNHDQQNGFGVTYSTNAIQGTNAVVFDGTGGIQLNDGTFLEQASAEMSVGFWIKPDDITPGTDQILFEEGDNTDGISIRLTTTGEINYRVRRAGGNELNYSAPFPTNDAWHHIALSYDAVEAHWLGYIDGQVVVADDAGADEPLAHADGGGFGNVFGGVAGGGGSPYTGLMDEAYYANYDVNGGDLIQYVNCYGLSTLPSSGCPTDAYLLQGKNTTTIDPQINNMNLATGEFGTRTNEVEGKVNAAGFNELDGLIYSVVDNGGGQSAYALDADAQARGDANFFVALFSVDNSTAPPTYTRTTVGPISGIAQNNQFPAGDVGNGRWYIKRGGQARFFVIDVDPTSATYLEVIDDVTITGDLGTTATFDLIYNEKDDTLYALSNNEGNLYSIDPVTGASVDLGNVAPSSLYGAAYQDSDGNMYFQVNGGGEIYRVNYEDLPNPPEASLFATGPSAGNNDGARCASAPLPLDWGDAPDSYKTTFASDTNCPGPYHLVNQYNDATKTSDLMLGSQISVENDGQTNENAEADNYDDAITVFPTLSAADIGNPYSLDITVNNNTTNDATLVAWIDFDRDGEFQADEGVSYTVAAGFSGEQTVTWTIPGDTTDGDFFYRVRLSTGTNLANNTINYSCGIASDGEVEDGKVPTCEVVTCPPADTNLVCGTAPTICNAGFMTAKDTNNMPTANSFMWINEVIVNYQGSGQTLDGVEIVGLAGTDLSDYRIYEYEGSGAAYNSPGAGGNALSGTIDDETGCGVGAVWFDIPLEDSSPPDGIALVHVPSGTVISFLSAGSSNAIVATVGPASGMTSEVIRIVSSETQDDPLASIHLTGYGSEYSDYEWDVADASKGSINNCQGVSLLPVTFSDVTTVAYTDGVKRTTVTRTWEAQSKCGFTQEVQTITIDCPLIPELAISKTSDACSPELGDTVTYTITITNTGELALDAMNVSDSVCDGALTGPTALFGDLGTFDTNEVWQYTCTHVINAGDGNILTNVVTAIGLTNGVNVYTAEAANVVCIDVTCKDDVPIADSRVEFDEPAFTNAHGSSGTVIAQNGDSITISYNIWNDETGEKWTGADYATRPVMDRDDITLTYSFSEGPLADDGIVANFPSNTVNGYAVENYPGSEHYLSWEGTLLRFFHSYGKNSYKSSYRNFVAKYIDLELADHITSLGSATMQGDSLNTAGELFEWGYMQFRDESGLVGTVTQDSWHNGGPSSSSDVLLAADTGTIVTNGTSTCASTGTPCDPCRGSSGPNDSATKNANTDLGITGNIRGGRMMVAAEDIALNGNQGCDANEFSTTTIISFRASLKYFDFENLEIRYPCVGVAKDASVADCVDGVSRVTYSIIVTNMGNIELTDLTLKDSSFTNWGSAFSQVVSLSAAGLTSNGAYDGTNNIELVSGGTLATGSASTITLVIDVVTTNCSDKFTNQVKVCAKGNNYCAVDYSQDGTEPDPNSNDDPTDNNTETVIQLVDTNAPTISNVPVSETLSCNTNPPNYSIGTVTFSDDCKIVSSNFTSNVLNDCITKITYTWTVTDACDNAATTSIVVNIPIDDTDPTASNPADTTVQCIGDVPAIDVAVVTNESDNCDTNPTVTFISASTNGTCPTTIVRTYRITDDCSNTTDVIHTITINDTTEPTASNPAATNVQCLEDVPAVDVTVVTNEADNCDTNPTVTFVSATTNGTCPTTIVRTYRVTDDCTNTTDVTHTITINDTTEPTASNPATTNVQCLEDVPAVDVTVVTNEADNCDTNPTVTFVSATTNGTCPTTIVRTYRVTDDCTNTTDVTHTITINDTIEPEINCPNKLTAQCEISEQPPYSNFTEFVNSGGSITKTLLLEDYEGGASFTHTSGGLNSAPPGTSPAPENGTNAVEYSSGSVYLTWAYKWSGSFSSAPVFPAGLQDLSLYDIYEIDILVPVGMPTNDGANFYFQLNMDTPAGWSYWEKYVPQIQVPSDGKWHTVRFALNSMTPNSGGGGSNPTDFTNAMGVTVGMTYDSTGTNFPLKSAYFDNVRVTDSTSTNDNCGIDTNTFALLSEVSDGATCPETITRTYIIEDYCGNTGQCTQVITVQDTTKPEIICPSLSNMEGNANCEYTIETLSATVTDNCSASNNITINQSPPNGTIVVGPTNVVITLNAIDECNNTNSCVVTQVVTCPDADVSVDISDPPDCVCENSNVTFTIVVTNDGNATLTNVTTTVPYYPACGTNVGTLAVGASFTYTCTVAVTNETNSVIAEGYSATGTVSATNGTSWNMDTVPPVITCPNPGEVALGVDCSTNLPTFTPTVTDVCTTNSNDFVITQSPTSGMLISEATNITITLTAKDLCGNIETCTFVAAYSCTTLGSIGDYVWDDTGDTNGMQDATNSGLDGVTVILYSNNVAIATQVTAGGGAYLFSNLPAFTNYVVEFVLLPGYGFTPPACPTCVESNNSDAVDFTHGSNVARTLAIDLGTGSNLTDVADAGMHDFSTTYVGIKGIRGLFVDGVGVIEWQTASENGSASFDLLRVLDEGEIQLNPVSLLAASEGYGALYRVQDAVVVEGGRYRYVVREHMNNGLKRRYGPYEVVIGEMPLNYTVPQEIVREADLRRMPLLRAALPVPADELARISNHVSEVKAERELRDWMLGEAIRIEIEEDGLYILLAEEIAWRLGIPDWYAQQLILAGELVLNGKNGRASYWPGRGGEALYFYGMAYSDTFSKANVYTLSWGLNRSVRTRDAMPLPDDGLGVIIGIGSPPETAPVPSFREHLHLEKNIKHQIVVLSSQNNSTDYFYWGSMLSMDYGDNGMYDIWEINETFLTPGRVEDGSEVEMLFKLKGGDTRERQISGTLNGEEILNIELSQQEEKAYAVRFAPSLLNDGANQVHLSISGHNGGLYGLSKAHLNYMEIDYDRRYEAVDGQLAFEVSNSGPISLKGMRSEAVIVADISEPGNPVLLENLQYENGIIQFEARAGKYIASEKERLKTPAQLVTQQHDPSYILEPATRADYIVLSTRELLAPAQQLADYRASKGHQSIVIEIEDLYAIFNHNRPSPQAISAFINYILRAWDSNSPPRYLTLCGAASLDYQNIYNNLASQIPTHIESSSVGLWSSDQKLGNPTGLVPKLCIGRLPASNSEILSKLVKKIIRYEAAEASPWEKRLLFVAGHNDGSHNFQNDNLTAWNIISNQTTLAPLNASGAIASQVIAELNTGCALFSYLGHGSKTQLDGGNVLSTSDLNTLQNAGREALCLWMTCDVANYADPEQVSLAEALLCKAEGGAIGIIGASGRSVHIYAKELNKKLIQLRYDGTKRLLGDLYYEAAQQYHSAQPHDTFRHLRMYNLLGDPALELK